MLSWLLLSITLWWNCNFSHKHTGAPQRFNYSEGLRLESKWKSSLLVPCRSAVIVSLSGSLGRGNVYFHRDFLSESLTREEEEKRKTSSSASRGANLIQSGCRWLTFNVLLPENARVVDGGWARRGRIAEHCVGYRVNWLSDRCEDKIKRK